MSDIYEVAVIGGGAAGLMAAAKAGEDGLKTVILEKKSRPGIKLSITGKGRCNFTNSAGLREFVGCFRNGEFLYSAFKTFSNNDTVAFFESLGVACKLERGGRYFPASGKASDIVNALVKYAKKYSSIRTSFEVKSLHKNEKGLFVVNGGLLARNVIIASGGITYPSTGSTGDGYKMAQSFGHKISSPAAALVPVNLKTPLLKELKGLKLKNVEVSLINQSKNIIEAKEFGEMEFTAYGADGPVILSISGIISENAGKAKMRLSVNLKPALNKEKLEQRLLRELDEFGQYGLKDMLKELLPLRIIKPFISYCGLNMTKKCSQISKAERGKISASLFDFGFEADGVRGVREAIITRGGVLTDEIEQKTMRSKLVEGLFFCGEIIDIDAPTGGFNLQAAFSTGYLAGGSIKKSAQRRDGHA